MVTVYKFCTNLVCQAFIFLTPLIETCSLFKNMWQNTQNNQCLQNNLKIQLCFAQLVNLLKTIQ